jgi:hypothetical protein
MAEDSQNELNILRGEVERLRAERDRYRDESLSMHRNIDEVASAQLRLLSAALAKENREELFGWLSKLGVVGGVLLLVATLGGAFTISDLISQRIQSAVDEREADISKLRDDVIQAVVDFKVRANDALEQIQSATTEVATESEKARQEIAARSRLATEGATTIVDREQGVIVLPLVVHVVHRGDDTNISDAQIKSQLDVLNADFRARNTDISKVPAPFKARIGDAKLEFVLASSDPNGRPTTGIVRTRTTVDGFLADDQIKTAKRGGSDAWPTSRYVNIWVGTLKNGILGYAQFPGGPAETDGIVIHHQAFGTTGTAVSPFNKGRTTTSQIGRYLNLRHIWGDTPTCAGDDFVADTPVQAGPNFGTPTFPHVSCKGEPNGDMFMNFADYVDDEAMVMFTQGQVARMRETLEKERRRLWQP